MKFLQFIKNSIPNCITSMNLLSGCLAVIFSFKSSETFGALQGYELSFIFIGLAAVFDFCDGFSARLLHAYSALGKELDSLADLISFGLAPAMLLFNTMVANNPEGSILPYFSLLLAVFGALRLAKFNIDDRQTTTFTGLPIPANAIFWIGFIAWIRSFGYIQDYIILIIVVLFSYLMVSKIRMFSLKFKNLNFAENLLRYVLILATILFVLNYGVSGFAWTILLYIVLSVFSRQVRNS